MPQPPFNEPAFWQARLQERTTRLAKLAALKAPPFVIGSELVLVLKAAMALDPESVGLAFAHFYQQQARDAMGLCRFCGQPNPRAEDGEPMCLACELEAASEDDEPTSA